jgi:hypothetical protein
MNTDCAFFMGSDHKVCQDYAVAHTDPDYSYVIVADGCSSSPNTDIGARFLVKAAETFMYLIEVRPAPIASLQRFHEQSAHFAALSSKFLRLDPHCLDATMLTIKATGRHFVASCYGDGVVAMVRNDGNVEIYSVEFVEGFPQYVSYMLDANRRLQFDKQTNNHKEVTRQIIPDIEAEVKVDISDNVIEFHYGTREDYYCVAVFSDGVHSFTEAADAPSRRAAREVPMAEVVSQILAFKSTKGDFVYRHMRAFQKFCASRRWQHHDDLSVGVVYLGN